ncbi:MAG: hypothetical protein CMJ32_05415 [Phycisphaerae bacterium]|nr:hypothetical protein [Phycisphaerae bacterium]
MIHDHVFRHHEKIRTRERRSDTRNLQDGEIVLVWHHDPSSRVRLELVDISDNGARVRTSIPLVKGMTGIALNTLPGGGSLDTPIMVRWCSSIDEQCWEAGLEFFGSA